jgi:hypothetical protein
MQPTQRPAARHEISDSSPQHQLGHIQVPQSWDRLALSTHQRMARVSARNAAHRRRYLSVHSRLSTCDVASRSLKHLAGIGGELQGIGEKAHRVVVWCPPLTFFKRTNAARAQTSRLG